MTDNRQGMTPSWRLAHPILQGGSAGLRPPSMVARRTPLFLWTKEYQDEAIFY